MARSLITTEDKAAFSERLRSLLIKLGWTQTRLADESNLTITTLSRWIATKHPPSTAGLSKVIDATGCSAAWLIYGQGTMFFNDDEESPEPENDKKELLAKILKEAEDFVDNDSEDIKGKFVSLMYEISRADKFQKDEIRKLLSLVFKKRTE